MTITGSWDKGGNVVNETTQEIARPARNAHTTIQGKARPEKTKLDKSKGKTKIKTKAKLAPTVGEGGMDK
jgi:hypothetical protein